MTNVACSYQWLSSRDTEIDGAASLTYTIQSYDNGKVIKVRGTFTDDGSNEEALTCGGTSAVVMGGLLDTAMRQSAKLLYDRHLSRLALLALSVPVMLLLIACRDDDAGLSGAEVKEIVLAEMGGAPHQKRGLRR